MSKKRLALTNDGKLTYCVAPEDKIGQGNCNHVVHQRKGERKKDFIKRVNKIMEIQHPDYEITLDDLKEFCKNNPKARENERYNILRVIAEESGMNITLKGGFSIEANKTIGNYDIGLRNTKDLDINWTGEGTDAEKALQIVDLLNNHGYKAEIRTTPNREHQKIRIVYGKNPSGQDKVITIDLGKDDNDVSKGIVKSMNDILGEKIRLKFEVPRKRFKDLVDSQLIIQMKYPNGITKEELLKIVHDTNGVHEFINNDNLKRINDNSKEFHDNQINGYTPKEYCVSFQKMLEGLDDPDIPENSKFYFLKGWEN